MQRSSVLLPDPDGPIRHTTSPAPTSRSTDLRTWLLPKDFETSSARTMGSAVAVAEGEVVMSGGPLLAGELSKGAVEPGHLHGAATAGEALLEVVLTDTEDARHDQVPDRRDQQQRNGLEVLGVDQLAGVQQVGHSEHADQRGGLEHADGLVTGRRDDHP